VDAQINCTSSKKLIKEADEFYKKITQSLKEIAEAQQCQKKF